MMKNVKRKLKSGTGASIIISLMFFLVVMMVGAVCLVAANNNSGRATHARDDIQQYYAIESAINLLKEDLSKEKAKFVLKRNGAVYDIEVPEGGFRYGKIVYDLMKKTVAEQPEQYNPSEIQSQEQILTVTSDNEPYSDSVDVNLSGVLILGSKIFGSNREGELDFDVEIRLWSDEGAYGSTLVFPAYVRKINVYNPGTKTVTEKIEVSWDDPQVTRQEA